jgi:hypothetical protein
MSRLAILGLFLIVFHFYTNCEGQEARYYNNKGRLVSLFLQNQELIDSRFKKDDPPYKLIVNDSNGHPFISIQLKDSLLHGKFLVYSPGRKLIVKGHFTKGKASGNWVFHDPFGKRLYAYNLDTFPDIEFVIISRGYKGNRIKGSIFLKSATQVEKKYSFGNKSGWAVNINVHQQHVTEDDYNRAHYLMSMEINEAGLFSSDIINPYAERKYYMQWNPKLKNKNKVSQYSKNIVHFCYAKDKYVERGNMWNLDLYIINYYSWGISDRGTWITKRITDSTYKVIAYNEKGELTSDKSYIKVLREKCPPKELRDFFVKDYFMDVYGRTNKCHLEEVVLEHGTQRLFDYHNKWVEYNMKYGVYDQ